MSFVYSKYIYLVIVFIIALVILLKRNEKTFFSWVYDNWFYQRSFVSKISSLAFVIGISLLTISLLDLRGAEQKVEGEVSDKKTILLIDSSLSMLAEDVRPNRYDKAVFIARHFIKNSAGHKISVILFSDTHKKLVPFTRDRELLDSRVAALADIGVSGGGTGLKQAVQESIQYFGSGEKKSAGNILIITDAEETNQGFSLKVPDNITVGVVGVGTSSGGLIPLRDKRGVSRGFKKYEGKNVTTKLDENFLKKIGEDIKYYNFWIASSFSLPTNEILAFFNQSVQDRKSKDNVTIRPVYAEILMIPGILMLALSFFLRFFRAFEVVTVTCLLFVFSSPRSMSQDEDAPKELSLEEIQREQEIQLYLNKWKKRELSEEEKLDLASKYSQNKVDEKAAAIYEQTLDGTDIYEDNKLDHFNWATTKLRQKDFTGSLDKLKRIKKFIEENPSPENDKLLEDVRKNTLLALKKQKSESKKKKKQKSGKGDSKDQKQKSGGKDDKESENKKSKDGDGDKEEEKQKKKDEGDGGEKKDENKKKKKKKLPGLLKQLLNEDRKLQRQLLDTSTNKKENTGKRRDW